MINWSFEKETSLHANLYNWEKKKKATKTSGYYIAG